MKNIEKEKQPENVEKYYRQTLETHREWKRKGLNTTQIIILSYRLRIMSSPKANGWNVSNKKMAELFDVSEDTIERAWIMAEKVGLLPPNIRIRAEYNPHPCGNEPASVRNTTRIRAEMNPHPCGNDDSNFIGKTKSLTKSNKHYKENSKETITEDKPDTKNIKSRQLTTEEKTKEIMNEFDKTFGNI